jgi:putative sterol carrier protein
MLVRSDNTTRPTAAGVRLVQLSRIRTSNVDSMMRNMPQYFRASEAAGMRFTCRLELTGEGGGAWTIAVADQRCRVVPGREGDADLTVRCPATLFLAIHRGEASAPWALLTRRLKLAGERRLFLTFPRLFGTWRGDGLGARLWWLAVKLRSWRGRNGTVARR